VLAIYTTTFRNGAICTGSNNKVGREKMEYWHHFVTGVLGKEVLAENMAPVIYLESFQ
jgi:hypothetical protein